MSYLNELIEDEGILEDPLNRLDEDGPHVEAGHLRLERLHSFLKHLLGLLKSKKKIRHFLLKFGISRCYYTST